MIARWCMSECSKNVPPTHYWTYLIRYSASVSNPSMAAVSIGMPGLKYYIYIAHIYVRVKFKLYCSCFSVTASSIGSSQLQGFGVNPGVNPERPQLWRGLPVCLCEFKECSLVSKKHAGRAKLAMLKIVLIWKWVNQRESCVMDWCHTGDDFSCFAPEI